MDEETKTNEGTEGTTEDNGNGNNSKIPKSVIEANLAAKRLEEANAKKEELLEREEALAVQRALGGKAEAGTPTEKKEESDSDYAKRALSGDFND